MLGVGYRIGYSGDVIRGPDLVFEGLDMRYTPCPIIYVEGSTRRRRSDVVFRGLPDFSNC